MYQMIRVWSILLVIVLGSSAIATSTAVTIEDAGSDATSVRQQVYVINMNTTHMNTRHTVDDIAFACLPYRSLSLVCTRAVLYKRGFCKKRKTPPRCSSVLNDIATTTYCIRIWVQLFFYDFYRMIKIILPDNFVYSLHTLSAPALRDHDGKVDVMWTWMWTGMVKGPN